MTILHVWFAYLLEWAPHPYLVPFVGAFVGGEETILVISALAAGGLLSFTPLLAMSFLGTMASDMLWFLFGVRFASWLETKPRMHEKFVVIERFIEEKTKGRDMLALLITKFLYGTRLITIFYLARKKMPFRVFFVYNVLVTALWSVVVCVLGWMAGQGVSWIATAFGNVTFALSVLIIVGIVLYGARIWLNKIIVERSSQ